MVRTADTSSIDSQIASYVSALSESRKQAVLTVAKTFAEDEAAEFERKWAMGVSEEETFDAVHNFIKTLEWKPKA